MPAPMRDACRTISHSRQYLEATWEATVREDGAFSQWIRVGSGKDLVDAGGRLAAPTALSAPDNHGGMAYLSGMRGLIGDGLALLSRAGDGREAPEGSDKVSVMYLAGPRRRRMRFCAPATKRKPGQEKQRPQQPAQRRRGTTHRLGQPNHSTPLASGPSLPLGALTVVQLGLIPVPRPWFALCCACDWDWRALVPTLPLEHPPMYDEYVRTPSTHLGSALGGAIGAASQLTVPESEKTAGNKLGQEGSSAASAHTHHTRTAQTHAACTVPPRHHPH